MLGKSRQGGADFPGLQNSFLEQLGQGRLFLSLRDENCHRCLSPPRNVTARGCREPVIPTSAAIRT